MKNEITLTITRDGREILLTLTGDYSGEDYQIADETGRTYHDMNDLTQLEWNEIYAALDEWNVSCYT